MTKFGGDLLHSNVSPSLWKIKKLFCLFFQSQLENLLGLDSHHFAIASKFLGWRDSGGWTQCWLLTLCGKETGLELLTCSFMGLGGPQWLFNAGRSAGSFWPGVPCAGWILGEALLSSEGVLREAPQSYKTSYDLALLDIYCCHILLVKNESHGQLKVKGKDYPKSSFTFIIDLESFPI